MNAKVYGDDRGRSNRYVRRFAAAALLIAIQLAGCQGCQEWFGGDSSDEENTVVEETKHLKLTLSREAEGFKIVMEAKSAVLKDRRTGAYFVFVPESSLSKLSKAIRVTGVGKEAIGTKSRGYYDSGQGDGENTRNERGAKKLKKMPLFVSCASGLATKDPSFVVTEVFGALVGVEPIVSPSQMPDIAWAIGQKYVNAVEKNNIGNAYRFGLIEKLTKGRTGILLASGAKYTIHVDAQTPPAPLGLYVDMEYVHSPAFPVGAITNTDIQKYSLPDLSGQHKKKIAHPGRISASLEPIETKPVRRGSGEVRRNLGAEPKTKPAPKLLDPVKPKDPPRAEKGNLKLLSVWIEPDKRIMGQNHFRIVAKVRNTGGSPVSLYLHDCSGEKYSKQKLEYMRRRDPKFIPPHSLGVEGRRTGSAGWRNPGSITVWIPVGEDPQKTGRRTPEIVIPPRTTRLFWIRMNTGLNVGRKFRVFLVDDTPQRIDETFAAANRDAAEAKRKAGSGAAPAKKSEALRILDITTRDKNILQTTNRTVVIRVRNTGTKPQWLILRADHRKLAPQIIARRRRQGISDECQIGVETRQSPRQDWAGMDKSLIPLPAGDKDDPPRSPSRAYVAPGQTRSFFIHGPLRSFTAYRHRVFLLGPAGGRIDLKPVPR